MTLANDNRTSYRKKALAHALIVGASVIAIELVFVFAKGWSHGPRYLATCAGLTLAFSAVVGFAGSFLLQGSLVLPAWVGVAGWLVGGWPVGAGMALVTWLGVMAIRPAPSRSFLPIALGGSFALAFLVSSKVSRLLANLFPDMPAPRLASWLVFAAMFLGLLGARRLSTRRLPSRVTTPLLVVLLLAVAALPALDARENRLKRRDLSTGESGPDRPSVLLVVMDTVRADHLSVYGYGRETTPELAALLERRPDAALFEMAFSNGTWTVPSHASLLTGKLPSEHGAQFGRARSRGFSILAERTLAELLAENGYTTIAVFANYWLKRVRGMDRGFEVYAHSPKPPELPLLGERLRRRLFPSLFALDSLGGVSAASVNRMLLKAIDSSPGRPVFALVNYLDAHAPYTPPRDFLGRFGPWSVFDAPNRRPTVSQPAAEIQRLTDRYDEEILGLDHQIGRLLAELDSRDLLDDSWVFITSDHGEAFGEHGVTEHGTTVYDEVIRIPLIVVPPVGVDLEPTRDPVSLIDVTQTIAAIAGLSLDGPGIDLREAEPGPAVIEFYGDPTKYPIHGELAKEPAQAIVRGRYKLVRHAGRVELYDLVLDPGEHDDIAALHPDLVAELEALAVPLELSDVEDTDWDQVLGADELEELRDLGYLGGDG